MDKKFYRQMKFILPIYDQNIYFIETNDYEELNKTHPTSEESEPFAFTETLYSIENGVSTRYYAMIINTKYPYLKPSIGTIAHECLHIVNMIFGVIKAKPDFKNDEHQAYLLEYFVDKAMEFYYPKTLM